MSERSRRARRLASILCKETGAFVTAEYRSDERRYAIVWDGNPTVARMQAAAHRHTDEVGALDLSALLWEHRDLP